RHGDISGGMWCDGIAWAAESGPLGIRMGRAVHRAGGLSRSRVNCLADADRDRARRLVDIEYHLAQFHPPAVLSRATTQSAVLVIPEHPRRNTADALARSASGPPRGRRMAPPSIRATGRGNRA